MAKTDALSIYLTDGSTKDKLLELYVGLLENIQKESLSEILKNKNYSGDPNSGSVEIKRFVNSTVADYGTARTNGFGAKVKNNSVIINVDTDKEIVEEIEMKDIQLYGVDGIISQRQMNHIKRMSADLDRAFFTVVESSASAFVPTGTTVMEKLEQLIQSVEITTNNFVDGIDRDMLVITASPSAYGKLRNELDGAFNTGITTKDLSVQSFHGVPIYPNTRQTADLICMIDGAVGQLVLTNEYQAERIQLSNSVGVSLFYSRGTKAVMPDLIAKITSLSA